MPIKAPFCCVNAIRGARNGAGKIPICMVSVLLLCASGCGDLSPVRRQTLPIVARTDFTVPPDLILSGSELIAVSPGGHVAVAALYDDSAKVIVLDSTGAVISRLGRLGDGPGEIRNVGAMLFSGDTLLFVMDMMNMRTTAFSVPVGSTQIFSFGTFAMPLRHAGDSLDVFGLSSSGEPEIRRMSLASTDGRRIVSTGDSSFRGVVSDERARRTPSRASAGGRVVLASGGDYQVLIYDSAGAFLGVASRDLPPARMTENQIAAALAEFEKSSRGADPAGRAREEARLRDRTVPHFSAVGAMGFDSLGRLWIAGTEADSAFLDVFRDTTFLGRLSIGCPAFKRRWSISGEWIAFVCEDDAGGTIQAYRILDQRH